MKHPPPRFPEHELVTMINAYDQRSGAARKGSSWSLKASPQSTSKHERRFASVHRFKQADFLLAWRMFQSGHLVRVAMPAEVRSEVFLVKFDLKFDISNVKYLLKFGGKTFRPARKAPNILGGISGRISAVLSETSFQMRRFWKVRSTEGRC